MAVRLQALEDVVCELFAEKPADFHARDTDAPPPGHDTDRPPASALTPEVVDDFLSAVLRMQESMDEGVGWVDGYKMPDGSPGLQLQCKKRTVVPDTAHNRAVYAEMAVAGLDEDDGEPAAYDAPIVAPTREVG